MNYKIFNIYLKLDMYYKWHDKLLIRKYINIKYCNVKLYLLTYIIIYIDI